LVRLLDITGMSMDITLVTVVGQPINLLSHMLDHYESMGITRCEVHVHLRDQADPALDNARQILTPRGHQVASVTVGGVWIGAQLRVQHHMASLRPDANEWYILADQDELQAYPEPIDRILDKCGRAGYDYVCGCMLDRVASDGTLREVAGDTPIWRQFPMAGFFTYPILRGNPRKIVAMKGGLRLAGSGHHYAENGCPCPLSEYFIQVHHFKWTAGLVDHLRERIRILRAIGNRDWQESDRALAYLESNEYRISLSDPRFLMTDCGDNYPHWPEIKKLISILPPRPGFQV
jgi:hypothetical protein